MGHHPGGGSLTTRLVAVCGNLSAPAIERTRGKRTVPPLVMEGSQFFLLVLGQERRVAAVVVRLS
jgi:hypothetical protein